MEKIETSKYEFCDNFKHSMESDEHKKFCPKNFVEIDVQRRDFIKISKRIKIEWYNIGKKGSSCTMEFYYL